MPSRLSPGRDALVVSPAMSGHSKWSQIKRQKGAADVKRGMVFTKMAKEIMLGAEDVEVEPGLATVYTTPTSFERVKKALEAAGIKTGAAELSMRPTTTVRVEGDAARKLLGLVETLEDLDDVIKVHANFDVPEEVLQHA